MIDKSTPDTADWVIVGGGLSGCVLAHRLKEKHPDKSVILLEAGPNEHENPRVLAPLEALGMHGSDLHYNYRTAPQKHLNGRTVQTTGGKMLSGGSAANYGVWTRGDAADYDEWADKVGDQGWSYNQMLPYFRRIETYHIEGPGGLNKFQHGSNGPVNVLAGNREYGLRDPVRDAYQEIGMRYVHDANAGYPHGLALLSESWHQGKRTLAGVVYPLDKVDVITNAVVRRVLFDTSGSNPRAIGAELVDGRTFHANHEVIVSCGAYRTPQVLMLSGIGPQAELAKHNIPQLVELPVGHNLHDHTTVTLPTKLKHPEQGLAIEHPDFLKDPRRLNGLPHSWVVTEAVDLPKLKAALEKDGQDTTNHPLLGARGHFEALFVYGVINEIDSESSKHVPLDGSIVTIGVMMALPTSRGTITLASDNPEDKPIIDPKHLDTEADKVMLREGIKRMLTATEAPALQEHLAEQLPPPGYPILTSQSSDEEIDARARHTAHCWWHPGGSAEMGKVIDTDLKVKGVDGLRVCDASIYPVPLAAHYQAVTYATAERGADIIAAAA